MSFSPEDRIKRITTLRTAYSIWSARRTTSVDALHASRVLGAILNRIDPPSILASTSSSAHMTSTPSYGSVPTISEEMMPQQALALNSNDIPAYNVTDDMSFVDSAGDAMLSFEEMFDDTNMFDWVRTFFSPFTTLFSVPIGRSNTQTFTFSTNRVLSTSISNPTPDPGDNSSPTPAYSPHYILLPKE